MQIRQYNNEKLNYWNWKGRILDPCFHGLLVSFIRVKVNLWIPKETTGWECGSPVYVACSHIIRKEDLEYSGVNYPNLSKFRLPFIYPYLSHSKLNHKTLVGNLIKGESNSPELSSSFLSLLILSWAESNKWVSFCHPHASPHHPQPTRWNQIEWGTFRQWLDWTFSFIQKRPPIM